MAMDLTGIINCNEYYTNHYFSSIFEENASATIATWKQKAKEEEMVTPWAKFRDSGKKYYRIRDRYMHLRSESQSEVLVKEMADTYLAALGYSNPVVEEVEVADGVSVPLYLEVSKHNGAPFLWVLLTRKQERDNDIMEGISFNSQGIEEDGIDSSEVQRLSNDEILSKIFFEREEAPRWVMLIGINQIALIDRNKWNEKRYLKFDLDEIFSRHEETTFQAMTILLHKESLCPNTGTSLLDKLDENSHKHSAGVSDALKYALRECIELLGNEVIYDMKNRQQIDLDKNPIDASKLTIECLRYMYRILFMLFIEARPELGYAPMKSQVYVQGYSLEGLRDITEKIRNEENEEVGEGYYLHETMSKLFELIYEGYPGDAALYEEASSKKSLHDVFVIEPLKAHIFDPEYTSHITNAKLRNSVTGQTHLYIVFYSNIKMRF